MGSSPASRQRRRARDARSRIIKASDTFDLETDHPMRHFFKPDIFNRIMPDCGDERGPSSGHGGGPTKTLKPTAAQTSNGRMVTIS